MFLPRPSVDYEDDSPANEDDAAFVWLQAAVQEILTTQARLDDPLETPTSGRVTA